MKRIKLLYFLGFLALILNYGWSESELRNELLFVEKKNDFKSQLEKKAKAKAEKKEEPEIEVKMDFSGVFVPESPEKFIQAWHYPTISQDLTGSCWAFSSVSFFESEIYRLSKRKIKLSVMYTVYWEFVEKARRFVKMRGDSNFGRGSQANATMRIWKQYGVIPAEDYGMIDQEKEFYNDKIMFSEMENFLDSVKQTNQWDESAVVETIRSILDHHMGKPPETIMVDGTEMTPLEYFRKIVRLHPEDYIDLLSFKKEPYFKKTEYKVCDNWWHSRDYLNVPLEDFMNVIKQGVRKGYTVCIVGDNSEPGFYPPLDCAVIADFDIPASLINENARQFRFENESTSDDHAIHLVGYLEKEGKDWYLIKDSGTKSRNGKHPGYMFYREDFVKLKMMNIMVHKDLAKNLLEKSVK